MNIVANLSAAYDNTDEYERMSKTYPYMSKISCLWLCHSWLSMRKHSLIPQHNLILFSIKKVF